MCLSKVTETYDNPSTMIMSAWKQHFSTTRAAGTGKPGLQLSFGVVVEFDTWMQATDKNAPGGIKADDGKSYLAGFHVYADDTQFKSSGTLRRVYVRRVSCLGDQDGKKALIAQEMYVPTDPNGWPPLASEPAGAAPVTPAPPTPPAPTGPAAKKKSATKIMLDRLKGKKES